MFQIAYSNLHQGIHHMLAIVLPVIFDVLHWVGVKVCILVKGLVSGQRFSTSDQYANPDATSTPNIISSSVARMCCVCPDEG